MVWLSLRMHFHPRVIPNRVMRQAADAFWSGVTLLKLVLCTRVQHVKAGVPIQAMVLCVAASNSACRIVQHARSAGTAKGHPPLFPMPSAIMKATPEQVQ